MMRYERINQLPALPDRPKEGHKGLFGRVLVVGGSESMLGAPVLAGTAALRLGAGLVQIAVPKAMLSAALSITPELIGLPLAASRIDRAAIDSADAIIIGPGMGQSTAAKTHLKQLLKLNKPAVIDADAVNLLAAEKKFPSMKLRGVLTPHPGEMNRLAKHLKRKEVPTDDRGRIALAVLATKTFGQLIVLKGSRTVVTDGTRVYVNTTGDSTLSKAGSGDVLCGVIGTLLGQDVEPFFAAAMGVWIHGKAGEIAGERFGVRSALAREVIGCLRDAIGEYERQF
jgi:NAD(P)H-hydrate epimerase